MLLGEEAVIA